MNKNLSLNLLELEVMLRLLNEQFVVNSDEYVHFVKGDELRGSIPASDFAKRMNNEPQQDASSLLAKAKYGEVVKYAAGVFPSQKTDMTSVFKCGELFREGKYLEVFEEVFSKASEKARQHVEENLHEFNSQNLEAVFGVAKRRRERLTSSNMESTNKSDWTSLK